MVSLVAPFLALSLAIAFLPPNTQDSPDLLRDAMLAEVVDALESSDWVVVDTRSTDAYNGWKMNASKRGGHLPGAVDFPASWLDSKRKDKGEALASALRDKEISPDRNILLYSKEKHNRIRVAAYLRSLGYRRLHGFDVTSWVEDTSKPLERYKNYHLLVPPRVVRNLLDGQRPETFERAKRVKFVEVSWGKEDVSYAKGHVPGSFHVNTDHFEPPPKWYLGDAKLLTKFANNYGFEINDTVVLSGEDPMASFRLAIVLRYIGVDDVRVLNGGLAAWKSAGYPIETNSHLPRTSKSFGAQIPKRPYLIDDLNQAKAGLGNPGEFTLVDTRTWAEFIGKTSGYKYHFRKGRIPGSVYGQAEFKGPNPLSPYRNIDNTMRNADEIQKLWADSGIDTRKHLSFFCGGGWRAAEVLTYAHVMGLNKASLFSDGWIGWSNDSRNPIESGPIDSEKNK